MKKLSKAAATFFILAFTLGGTVPGWAEGGHKVEDENYVVYYSAFNASFLTPDIAKQYGLMRSPHRGIANIVVQRKQSNGPAKAVSARLKGTATALGGSERSLNFKMITDSDAIYYLAEFLIGNGETLYFDIKVIPVPSHPGLSVGFAQEFFTAAE